MLKYEPEFQRTGHPTGQLLALLSLWHGRRRLERFLRRWRHRNPGVNTLRRLTGTLRRLKYLLRWLKGLRRRLNRLDLWGEKPGVGGEHQLQAYQCVAVPRTPAQAASLEYGFFYVLQSTLLHLPPLWFYCVGGCRDRTQDCCDFGIGSQKF